MVADQIRRGILNETEAGQSNLRNILLQAVGISEELDICQKSLPIQPGDCFLLCSDGLTGMLTDKEICEIMNSDKLPDQAVEKLISAALTAGGRDNITAVLVTADHK